MDLIRHDPAQSFAWRRNRHGEWSTASRFDPTKVHYFRRPPNVWNMPREGTMSLTISERTNERLLDEQLHGETWDGTSTRGLESDPTTESVDLTADDEFIENIAACIADEKKVRFTRK